MLAQSAWSQPWPCRNPMEPEGTWAEDEWKQAILQHAKGRGGKRQREVASTSSTAPLPKATRSALAEHLLVQWAHGFLSAPQLQTIAALSLKDIQTSGGRPLAAIEKLANLGKAGSAPEHIRSNLIIYVKTLVSPPSALVAKIPLKLLKGPNCGIHLLDQSYLEPHKWFSYLWETHREAFFARLVGPPGAIEAFLERSSA